MNLSDLAAIGSLVSGIAVLVSLVYLAQQTRQNSKHTRALIQQGRAIQSADMPLRTAENASLAELRLRGDEGDKTLNRIQFSQYWLLRISIFWMWEDQFNQHQDGLLDGARFAGTIEVMKLQFQMPGCRYVWKRGRMGFAPKFQAFVNDIMQQTRPGHFDAHAAWKTGIDAELPEALG
jgi:hypothetical protein